MTKPQTSVLVVEDEDSFIDALTIGLKREGFRVTVARDGAEALDQFDSGSPRPGAPRRHAAQGLGYRCLP